MKLSPVASTFKNAIQSLKELLFQIVLVDATASDKQTEADPDLKPKFEGNKVHKKKKRQDYEVRNQSVLDY